MIDSTHQIRELEQRVSARRVVPADPVLAFVDALIEDYADEWLTKAMFHYRWAFAPDIDKASRVLPRWSRVDADEARIERMSRAFAERQIGRLGVVGSSPSTAPVIEGSYRRGLAALDAVLSRHPFVLGGRPGAGDFALFGQLTQLAGFDPTPAAIAIGHPRVLAWIDLVEDLSGLEPEEPGFVPRDGVRESAGELLAEIGRVYVPFLLGNARALEAGADRVECEIDGAKWIQKPFPYQAKCLRWLRERRAALSVADRAAVDALLVGTGCEALFVEE